MSNWSNWLNLLKSFHIKPVLVTYIVAVANTQRKEIKDRNDLFGFKDFSLAPCAQTECPVTGPYGRGYSLSVGVQGYQRSKDKISPKDLLQAILFLQLSVTCWSF